jgi:P-type Ca2+ transporter type 2C
MDIEEILLVEKKNGKGWHTLEPEDVMHQLKSSTNQGLSNREAEQRLQSIGPNQLAEAKPVTFWQMVWAQLNSFVIWLLIGASLISALLGDYIEAGVIIAIVVLNTVLGVIQERRAEQALSALQKMAAPEAHVIRDGHRQTVSANLLVPGDLVLLEAGNFVPADIRLFETVNLRIDESPLTGESVPAQKDASVRLRQDVPLGDQKNTAFMGTVVNYGRGKGLVVSTGMHTQIGMIAKMLQAVDREQTPLQRKLDQLGKTLGTAAIVICVMVFLVGWLRGHAPLEMFMIAVGLAIAAVPEGLPTVVTISLALGMREMVNRHALIRRLSSVETLGSATVICTDKTGTLTQNQMTATQVWVDGYNFEIGKDAYQLYGEKVNLNGYPGALTTLWVAGLNNDGVIEMASASNGKEPLRLIGDPTETALLAASVKAGINLSDQSQAYPRVQEIPFDASRKRMVTIHALAAPRQDDASPFDEDQKDSYAVLVKGAPDIVLNLCQYYQKIDDTIALFRDEDRQRILAANAAMTQQALRVLAQAYRVSPQLPDVNNVAGLEGNLIFTGLVGMIDPPRPEVSPALAKAKNAGIRTIMITGDFPNTAHAIACSIGLLSDKHKVMTGAELGDLDDAQLTREVQQTDVFARVSPEHKMCIVEALQADGEVVAMTGDGVNDAPAIKRADIGVAMGISGTDVAKGSADMVLTDDNYASIVSAVEQGRVIYNNIRKFVFFLISSNLAEIAIIFLSTLAGLPTPLTVIQLLWLNLLTDGAPALALAMEKGDPDVMDQPPRKTNESIINGSMRLGIIIQTVVQTVAVLGAFFLGLSWHLGQAIPAGTNAFLYLLGHDWRGADVLTAETMAFVTLSLCELFRAYTVRSEKASLVKIGVFSNRFMQLAVGASILLLLAVVNVPFLQPIFNTHFLNLTEWAVVVGLALIPALAEELTKAYLRSRDKLHAAKFVLQQ